MSDKPDKPAHSHPAPFSGGTFLPSSDDQLEQALVEESVTAIRTQPCPVVPPDMTVQQAVETLVELGISCLLVAENEQLVGVFTKRDVLDKVALNYDEVKDQPLSDLMTRNPIFVYETEPVAAALCVMASGGHRHVPVVDSQNRIAGVVSPLRVTDFLSRFFGS
jgi:CBS domain-containing protein